MAGPTLHRRAHAASKHDFRISRSFVQDSELRLNHAARHQQLRPRWHSLARCVCSRGQGSQGARAWVVRASISSCSFSASKCDLVRSLAHSRFFSFTIFDLGRARAVALIIVRAWAQNATQMFFE